MTVANQTRRIAAVGNAAIGQEVPFSFPYAATSDITVYSRVTATGVETLLAETTNYTLTAASDTGGTLTTVTAVAATSEIHIIRDTPKTQALDLEAGGSFSAENQEDAFDKSIKLIIENRDSLDRALRAPATDAVALDLELPSSVDRASKNLGFDAGGNVTVTDSSGTFATQTAVWDDVIVKGPYVDVRSKGAVCDGTTNDAVALQAALDSMTSGGTLIIPGVCAIGSTGWTGITVTSATGITVRGIGASGGFKVLVAPSQTLEAIPIAFLYDTCTYIKTEHIDFNGNDISTALIGMSGCSKSTVNDNHLHDTTGALRIGIVATGGNKNKYTRNIIHDVQNGMLIGNTNPGKTETNVIISQNDVYDTRGTCIGGTLVGGIISNNQCIDGGSTGIALGSALTETYQNTTIVGNVCTGNVNNGIQFDVIGTAYVDGVTVIGNICAENGADGIQATRLINCTISGNVCRDNNYGGVGNGYGIQVSVFAKRVIVANNYCYDSRVGAARTQRDGIYVNSGSIADGVNNILLSANSCYNHARDGIHVTNASPGTTDKISLRGNHCFSNAVRGITVADDATGNITGITVIGNVAYDNVTADFRFDPPDTINFLNDAQTSQGVRVTTNSIMIADGTNWASGITVSYENEQVFYENEIVTV